MAGILQFALGLETSGFLHGIGLSSASILNLSGAMEALRRISAGMWAAVERGAALADLSAATGESAQNLYLLQAGFEAAGLSAEALPGMIRRLQLSLAGVDEQGNKAGDAFATLGLSAKDLARLNAPEQFERLAGALNQLPPEQKVLAASKLFGPAGAQAAAQLAGKAREFAAGMADATQEAEVFGRNAERFNALTGTLSRVRGHISGLFAGLAESLAPVLQNMADWLQGIDLVGMGKDIGTFITALTQTFREGTLSSLVADSFKLAFETVIDFLPAVFETVGAILIRTLEKPILYFQSAFEFAGQKVAEYLKRLPGFNLLLDQHFQAQSFQQIFAENQDAGVRVGFGAGVSTGEMFADAGARMSEARERFRKRFGEYWAGITDLASRAPVTEEEQKAARRIKPFSLAEPAVKSGREATSLEKMGFVMGGAGADPARDTAAHTRTMVGLLRETNRLLRQRDNMSFANA